MWLYFFLGGRSPPMSILLIGADAFLRVGGSLPEENNPKDEYLRPPQLRRSSAVHNVFSSGQHLLVEVELSGAMLFSGGHPLIGEARATRNTLGYTTNASASVLSICFPQTEHKPQSRAKLRCCLSKHPAASGCVRGRRLGAVRR